MRKIAALAVSLAVAAPAFPADPPPLAGYSAESARAGERFPEQLLARPAGASPHFFYLQYRPPFLRMQSVLPDLIHSLVGRLKGKVVVMSSPGDFEKGIQQIEHAGPLFPSR